MSTATDTAVDAAAAHRTRATPLELFFDLVYVFAFTQVTHLMADGESIESVLGGLAVLGVLWWSWASHAWLANQQVADRGPVRVGILAAIAIVLLLSIAIPRSTPSMRRACSAPCCSRSGSSCSPSSTPRSTSWRRGVTVRSAVRSSAPWW
jgi:low temperature requirement protein LtrA